MLLRRPLLLQRHPLACTVRCVDRLLRQPPDASRDPMQTSVTVRLAIAAVVVTVWATVCRRDHIASRLVHPCVTAVPQCPAASVASRNRGSETRRGTTQEATAPPLWTGVGVGCAVRRVLTCCRENISPTQRGIRAFETHVKIYRCQDQSATTRVAHLYSAVAAAAAAAARYHGSKGTAEEGCAKGNEGTT